MRVEAVSKIGLKLGRLAIGEATGDEDGLIMIAQVTAKLRHDQTQSSLGVQMRVSFRICRRLRGQYISVASRLWLRVLPQCSGAMDEENIVGFSDLDCALLGCLLGPPSQENIE